jgi:hypothetical protein
MCSQWTLVSVASILLPVFCITVNLPWRHQRDMCIKKSLQDLHRRLIACIVASWRHHSFLDMHWIKNWFLFISPRVSVGQSAHSNTIIGATEQQSRQPSIWDMIYEIWAKTMAMTMRHTQRSSISRRSSCFRPTFAMLARLGWISLLTAMNEHLWQMNKRYERYKKQSRQSSPSETEQIWDNSVESGRPLAAGMVAPGVSPRNATCGATSIILTCLGSQMVSLRTATL